MASPFSAPRFAKDTAALDAALRDLRFVACPHCRRTGTLIGHGFLRGFAEWTSEVEVRGRRFFCSDRGSRPGCGQTFSMLLTTLMSGFVVRTLTLWLYAKAVLDGLTRRAAWQSAARGTFSLSSGYRLWRRLSAAQSALRARLCREAETPSSSAREPLGQLVAHLAVVLGTPDDDPFAAIQNRLGHGVFDI